MPMPIAVAPPVSQYSRTRPRETVIRPARFSAAYEARVAMTTDSTTSEGMYSATRLADAPGGMNDLAPPRHPVIRDCATPAPFARFRLPTTATLHRQSEELASVVHQDLLPARLVYRHRHHALERL